MSIILASFAALARSTSVFCLAMVFWRSMLSAAIPMLVTGLASTFTQSSAVVSCSVLSVTMEAVELPGASPSRAADTAATIATMPEASGSALTISAKAAHGRRSLPVQSHARVRARSCASTIDTCACR